MKKLKRNLLYLLLMACYSSFAQETDTVKIEDIENIINEMCLERGHVMSENISVTLASCPPYLEEHDSISYMVYPSCNGYTSVCKRCGLIVKYYPKERRVVIWSTE